VRTLLPANAKVFYYSNIKKHTDNQTLLLYGRRVTDRQVYNFFINDFFPYFAVPLDEQNMRKIIALENTKVIVKHEMFADDEGKKTFHDQYNNPLVVIYTRTTKDHEVARGAFGNTFEDDVLYGRVFRKSKNIYGFFAIPEIETIFKRRPIHVDRKGHEIDVPYYIISHEQVIGF